LKAKKSYGQHFLTNEALSEGIAKSLKLTHTYKKVLEVGPGRGMLTKYLLKEDFELVVVEADRDMVFHLKKHYPELAGQIIQEDFLKVPLDVFFKNESFGLIGNFPYNISSQILFKMLVDRRNFNPPPKVQSAVIRLTRRDDFELGCNPKLFKQIVKQTFGQRRKMLRNTMKSFSKNPDFLANPFFTKRPEQLSLEDFIQVTKWVEETRS